MSRGLKKAQKVNGNQKAPHISQNMPQIQEFQNLIDSQKLQFEQMKLSYSQQNVQLAKSISNLMIKNSDLETKISELVQENVILRGKLSMKDLKHKEHINLQLKILEQEIFYRFEEIGNLFNSTREKCGIPRHKWDIGASLKKNMEVSPCKGVEFKNYIHKTSEINDRYGDQTNDIHKNSQLNEEEIQPLKKKRKSSRRESLFIPSDFEFFNENSDDIKNPDEDINNISSCINNTSDEGNSNNHPNTSIKEGEEINKEEGITNEEDGIQHQEDSFNFNNSIIDYSIPEEVDDFRNETRLSIDTSKSKIDVYKDNCTNQNISLENLNGQLSQLPFIPVLTSSQSKIKHSMKTPKSKSKQFMDEIMPQNDYQDIPRSRRTRGKAVNYTLPSLRAKMRRPTDKLVDATTVIDIHDLQVTKKRKQDRKNLQNNSYNTKEFLNDIKADETNKKSILQEIAVNKTPNKKVSFQKSNLNIKPPVKTRKLSKKSIVGNITDENSYFIDNNETTNFHINDKDLSVFDLIDDVKLKNISKTHRAKAKQEKRRHHTPVFTV